MDASDEADFREFVVGQWHALARTAYLLTGDRGDAEDLVQSTLVRVHRHWTRIERSDAPYVYARRVMVNLNTSIWRRTRISHHLTDAPPEPARPGAPDDTTTVDQRDELLRACRTLPPRMRAVLVLRYFEDLPEADVAAALGISVGTVKSQTSKALDRLRAELGALPATSRTTAPTTNGSPA
ncbi:SigE family RNA polymerase sigma factor [Kineosporia sp. A_224]|uniref:SigE family RNA polymerase sigma factor n=1 Tax=Kineosporia sp. A_224 TaxID=1962180 RepID=UPI000B4BD50A|nr:SigE family RNA polymerase sigma factor [Kineosporia sp. A_224]